MIITDYDKRGKEKNTNVCHICYDRVINIDEQLSILWNNVYEAILTIIDGRYSRECKLYMHDSEYLSYIVVTYDGVIKLCTFSGYEDYAEQFEDEFLYDAYRQLVLEL